MSFELQPTDYLFVLEGSPTRSVWGVYSDEDDAFIAFVTSQEEGEKLIEDLNSPATKDYSNEQFDVHGKVWREASKLAQASYDDEDQIIFTRKELKILWMSLMSNSDIRPILMANAHRRLIGHRVRIFYRNGFEETEYVQSGTLLDYQEDGLMFRDAAGRDSFLPASMVCRIVVD